jgi:hypothetical protein
MVITTVMKLIGPAEHLCPADLFGYFLVPIRQPVNHFRHLAAISGLFFMSPKR